MTQLISGLPVDAICTFQDGNQMAAVRATFRNMQESLAGFGATREEAIADLKRQESRDSYNTQRVWVDNDNWCWWNIKDRVYFRKGHDQPAMLWQGGNVKEFEMAPVGKKNSDFKELKGLELLSYLHLHPLYHIEDYRVARAWLWDSNFITVRLHSGEIYKRYLAGAYWRKMTPTESHEGTKSEEYVGTFLESIQKQFERETVKPIPNVQTIPELVKKMYFDIETNIETTKPRITCKDCLQWKANHDEMVARNKLLRDRTDLSPEAYAQRMHWHKRLATCRELLAECKQVTTGKLHHDIELLLKTLE